ADKLKFSKAAVNAYTRDDTRLMANKYPNMLIQCVHPGYVITGISAQTGYATPAEGVKAPTMVALFLKIMVLQLYTSVKWK
ncbi:(+)-neomenthol dehydrogenase-like protein, partial [Tanacetum coccineum]